MSLQASKSEGTAITDVIGRVLDKGLVINADICVSVVGLELLGIKIRAALASFETAAKYGLEFPSGTNLGTAAWKEVMVGRESCPMCGKVSPEEELINEGCPWCGWTRAKKKLAVSPMTPVIAVS
jgi:gas vesicle structural protein